MADKPGSTPDIRTDSEPAIQPKPASAPASEALLSEPQKPNINKAILQLEEGFDIGAEKTREFLGKILSLPEGAAAIATINAIIPADPLEIYCDGLNKEQILQHPEIFLQGLKMQFAKEWSKSEIAAAR